MARSAERSWVSPGRSPSFSASARYLALVPKTVTPLPLHQIPQHGRRRQRRAVEQHDRGADGEAGDQPVPHHPPAGGEVEDPVVPGEVGVQHQLLEVLEQRAARAVDHALRQARGAGGVHDVERVVEGETADGRTGGRAAGSAAASARPPVRPSAQSPHSTAPRIPTEVGPLGRDTAPPRPARSRGSARAPRAPGPASRSACRRSGSRRRRRALAAGSGRSGRARRWRRSRGSRRTRSRPGSPWRAWRSPSRAGSAGTPRRGRPGPMPCARSARRDRADLGSQLAIGERPLPSPLVPEHQRLAVVGEAEQVLGEVEPRRR